MTDPKELERLEGELRASAQEYVRNSRQAETLIRSADALRAVGEELERSTRAYTDAREARDAAVRVRGNLEEQVRVLLGAIQQAVNLIVALKDGRARFLLENTLAEVDALALSSVPPQGGEEGRHPGASPSAGPQAATAPSDAEPSAQGEQP